MLRVSEESEVVLRVSEESEVVSRVSEESEVVLRVVLRVSEGRVRNHAQTHRQ